MKLTRYTCREYDDDSIGWYADMVECTYGSYVSIDDLEMKLMTMLEATCDPGEKKALNSVLNLLDDKV